MRIPSFVLPALLRLHDHAQATPYFHLGGYMDRAWIFGDRSPARNVDRPAHASAWHGQAGGPVYCWLTERLAIRAHTILRSDREQHPHDHPCWSISIVLEGGYWEVMEPNDEARNYPSAYARVLELLPIGAPKWLQDWAELYNIRWRGPGAVVFRRASAFHRLILPNGTQTKSIFILGRRSNDWGFKTPVGKIGWRDYLGEPEA